MKKSSYILVGSVALAILGTATLVFSANELAKVNNTVITLEEFTKKYQENLKFFQGKPPSKKSVLDDLVKRELGVQEARKMGLDKDPEVIDRMNTVLYHAMLDKRLSKEFESIHITDAEAKQFYDKNPEIRVSHIFVAVPADAKNEDDQKALERIRKIDHDYLKPGKMSFAEVAQKYSDGVAAPMGGDIDFQTKDKLDPAFYNAAVSLKTPGKVSAVVRSQFGYHIIKLTAVRSWEETDKAQVKRLVFDERRAQLFEGLMKQLRQQAKVTVNGDLLKD